MRFSDTNVFFFFFFIYIYFLWSYMYVNYAKKLFHILCLVWIKFKNVFALWLHRNTDHLCISSFWSLLFFLPFFFLLFYLNVHVYICLSYFLFMNFISITSISFWYIFWIFLISLSYFQIMNFISITSVSFWYIFSEALPRSHNIETMSIQLWIDVVSTLCVC